MFLRLLPVAALISFVAPFAEARDSGLRQELANLAATAKGSVSVACSLPGSALQCDLNPAAKPPMQSVFKLPLAVAALNLVEAKKFSLDQQIRFLSADRILPKTYSPLQDKYPEANVDVPLRELLRLSVSFSDNAATDIILRLIGGPGTVDSYIKSLGIEGFHVEDNEAGLHRDLAAQYRNWFQPQAAVRLLRRLVVDPPLTPEHMALLLGWMRDGPSGAHRLKGLLPPGTVVMHKTGSSGVDDGVAHATNDIGLIALPDGRYLAIAVFVTDSRAGEGVRELVIAKAARAVYDAALKRSPVTTDDHRRQP